MCGRNVNVRRSELMSFDEYYYMYVWGSDCVSYILNICGLMCLIRIYLVLGVFVLKTRHVEPLFDDCYELWNQIISLVRRFLLCILLCSGPLYLFRSIFLYYVRAIECVVYMCRWTFREVLCLGNDEDENAKKTKRRCWWWWE